MRKSSWVVRQTVKYARKHGTKRSRMAKLKHFIARGRIARKKR